MTLSINCWHNRDNIQYYEAARWEEMHSIAVQAGLDQCPELAWVREYIWKASRLLEVGANYGRVLSYLTEQHFPGKIDAVERSQSCCALLQQRFGDQVTLYCQDIVTFSPKHRYEAILWLWSGISDFAVDEQPKVICHLANLLTSHGVLIMDTTCHERAIANQDSSTHQQEYQIAYQHTTVFGYRPSPAEISTMAVQAGLKVAKFLPYQTRLHYPRRLFVLQR